MRLTNWYSPSRACPAVPNSRPATSQPIRSRPNMGTASRRTRPNSTHFTTSLMASPKSAAPGRAASCVARKMISSTKGTDPCRLRVRRRVPSASQSPAARANPMSSPLTGPSLIPVATGRTAASPGQINHGHRTRISPPTPPITASPAHVSGRTARATAASISPPSRSRVRGSGIRLRRELSRTDWGLGIGDWVRVCMGEGYRIWGWGANCTGQWIERWYNARTGYELATKSPFHPFTRSSAHPLTTAPGWA